MDVSIFDAPFHNQLKDWLQNWSLFAIVRSRYCKPDTVELTWHGGTQVGLEREIKGFGRQTKDAPSFRYDRLYVGRNYQGEVEVKHL